MAKHYEQARHKPLLPGGSTKLHERHRAETQCCAVVSKSHPKLASENLVFGDSMARRDKALEKCPKVLGPAAGVT